LSSVERRFFSRGKVTNQLNRNHSSEIFLCLCNFFASIRKFWNDLFIDVISIVFYLHIVNSCFYTKTKGRNHFRWIVFLIGSTMFNKARLSRKQARLTKLSWLRKNRWCLAELVARALRKPKHMFVENLLFYSPFCIFSMLPPRWPWVQARNQLGTGGAKSFLRGVKIFWTMSNRFKPCPRHFSRGAKNFLRGLRYLCAPSGYGPAWVAWSQFLPPFSNNNFTCYCERFTCVAHIQHKISSGTASWLLQHPSVGLHQSTILRARGPPRSDLSVIMGYAQALYKK